MNAARRQLVEIVVAASREMYGHRLDRTICRAATEAAADHGVRLGSYVGATDQGPSSVLHHWRVGTTMYEIADGPKMLRETLCLAQSALTALAACADLSEDIDRLQRLIDECDRHRPLGPDGKHGDRHTDTCGCEL